MTKSHVVDGRILLSRNADEKKPLLQRLTRIEGQVRGLRAMVEDDRYCLDEVQQIAAISAALREVALLIIGDHVKEGVRVATTGESSDIAIADVMQVLRAAMKSRD